MQHPQQQRSFYRAKRPGNLNISCIDGSAVQLSVPFNNSQPSLQQQQQHQHAQPIQSPSHYLPGQTTSQQAFPQSPHPRSAYTNNNLSNYSYSPHIQQQVQQQTNPAVSPSYHAYQGHQYPKQSTYSNGYDTGQSYTPTYSPIASSAHIVNKQAPFFTFDVNNNGIANKEIMNGNSAGVNNPSTPGIQYSNTNNGAINGAVNSQAVISYAGNSGSGTQLSPNRGAMCRSPQQNPSAAISNNQGTKIR